MKIWIAAIRGGVPSVCETSASVKNGSALFDDGAGEKRVMDFKRFGLFRASDGALSAVGKTKKAAIKALAEEFKMRVNMEARKINSLSRELSNHQTMMRENHAALMAIRGLDE